MGEGNAEGDGLLRERGQGYGYRLLRECVGDVLLRGGDEYGKYVDSFVYLFSPHLISP